MAHLARRSRRVMTFIIRRRSAAAVASRNAARSDTARAPPRSARRAGELFCSRHGRKLTTTPKTSLLMRRPPSSSVQRLLVRRTSAVSSAARPSRSPTSWFIVLLRAFSARVPEGESFSLTAVGAAQDERVASAVCCRIWKLRAAQNDERALPLLGMCLRHALESVRDFEPPRRGGATRT